MNVQTYQIINLILAALTILVIPLGGYFYRSLRNEIKNKSEGVRELVRNNMLSIGDKLGEIQITVEKLNDRMTQLERDHVKLQLEISRESVENAQKYVAVTHYTGTFQGLDKKIDRFGELLATQHTEMLDRINAALHSRNGGNP